MSRHWVVALIAAFSLLLAACTEEKAKALRLAAETFKTEADTACAMGLAGLQRMVAMPPRTRADLAAKLESATKFGAPELRVIYSYEEFDDSAVKPAREVLDKACAAHRQLAAIYTDLPSGYLLATPDVQRAQKHVVNVTLRFAKLAHVFSKQPDLGKINPERIRIIEATALAKKVAEAGTRAGLLDGLAGDILVLEEKERASRAAILGQFGKAVELGDTLTRLSMDYEKLSVADILDSLQEFAVLYGDVTGRAVVAQNAIARVAKVEDRIRNDPQLKPLLDADL